jgi:hypothetical protein
MPNDTLTNLTHQVDRHEGELERDGKDIEALKKDVSTLLLLFENLFVGVGSVQRFRQEQEDAFKKIPELVKELRQRYPL